MFEEQSQQTTYPTTTIRIGVAIILLAFAVPLGIWVLKTVNTTINDTEKPAILQKICPEDTKTFDINTPAGRFELPKPAFTALSYFILYLFLIIPTAITLVLLKSGVALLNPDLTRQLRRFIDSIRKAVPPK
jgi:hypothetical protein